MVSGDQLRLAAQKGRGRGAEAPHEIPARGWKDIFWRLVFKIGEDRITLIAAGVTYYVLLALVPSLTALVSIYGLFTNPSTVVDHLSLLEGLVPQGGMDLIRGELLRLTEQGHSSLGLTLIVSLSIALWSASAAARSLFDAMNVAYGEMEKRNFFILSAMALVFTLGGVLGVIVLLSVVIVMPAVLAYFPLGGEAWLVRGASYLGLLALLSVATAVIYHWGPSRHRAKLRWITPGTVLSVLTIMLVSAIFSYYVANFGNYNAMYGSLGALVGFLTWIWLSIIALLLGAELNSEIEHQTAEDSTVGRSKPLGARGARMADSVGVSSNWEDDRERHMAVRQLRAQTRPLLALAVAVPTAVLADRWLRRRLSR